MTHSPSRFRWPVALAVLACTLLLASCGSADVGDDLSSTTTTTTTPATTTTTSSTTSTTSTTTGPLPQYTVSELLDLQAKQQVVVTGMVVATPAATLLCEALAESFPPQCAGRWVVVTNPGAIEADLASEGSVMWSDKPLSLTGNLVDGRFVLAGAPSGVEVTAADQALVGAFLEFARSGGDTSQLPIPTDGLSLGLADRLLLDRTAEELNDPSAWDIVFEPFRGRVAPFSAHELLSDPRESRIVVGPHDHCASPPWPVPEGLEELRQISIQPLRATSCLEWFTVDFFVDADGLVQAITLDLWEP